MSEQPKALMALVREWRKFAETAKGCHESDGCQEWSACWAQNADKLEAALKAWDAQLEEMEWSKVLGYAVSIKSVRERVLGVEEHGQSQTHS